MLPSMEWAVALIIVISAIYFIASQENRMGILLFLGLFGATNGEFFATANKQMVEGHEWNYVGKQSPDSSPVLYSKVVKVV